MTLIKQFNHIENKYQIFESEDELENLPLAQRNAHFLNHFPRSKQIQIKSVDLSHDRVVPGDHLTLTAEIAGESIAYIFAEVLFFDGKLNCLFGPFYRVYVRAEQDRINDRGCRPDWKKEISIAVGIPVLFRSILSGENASLAFVSPEKYGTRQEEKIWQLNGSYLQKESGTQYSGKASFRSSGSLKEITISKYQGLIRTAQIITPQPGDQFAPEVEIWTPPAGVNGPWNQRIGEANPLSIGEEPPVLTEGQAIPGTYFAGVVIKDLDGNYTRKYAPFVVKRS